MKASAAIERLMKLIITFGDKEIFIGNESSKLESILGDRKVDTNVPFFLLLGEYVPGVWTREQPFMNGWYWWKRNNNYNIHLWDVFYITIKDDNTFSTWKEKTLVDCPKGGWWSGPINMPANNK